MIEISENVSLKALNTFGFSANAQFFTECNSIEDVKETVALANKQSLPLQILGGGSNVLLTRNVSGLVLKMNILGVELLDETNEQVTLRVGAGENWHGFVLHALSHDWGGIENLSLIPGTVGAAPMQNIGAYGVEINQVFHSLRAVERATGEFHTFDGKHCAFGYRESVFKKSLKDKYVICDVTFLLRKAPFHKLNTSYGAIESVLSERGIAHPTIHDVSSAVISIRKSKLPDPADIGNSGSFFKNPTISNTHYALLKKDFPTMPGYPVGEIDTKVPAGWLIERCGWKGFERNGIGVHKLQALVLVNYGDGKGSDVEKLARAIQESVAKKFNIAITPEVNIL